DRHTRGHLLWCRSSPFHPAAQHSFDIIFGEGDRPTVKGLQIHEPKLGCDDDAESAFAAAQSPEQVRVRVFIGSDDLAGGDDHGELVDVVTAITVASSQRTESAAQYQAGQSDRGG